MGFVDRVFKITPQSVQDMERLRYILTSRTFYPDNIPTSYDETFDYRQLFIVMGPSRDNTGYLVYCREQLDDVSDFNTNIVPIADWITKYGLTNIPVITKENYTDIVNGRRTRTNDFVFLHWDYQLHNNK